MAKYRKLRLRRISRLSEIGYSRREALSWTAMRTEYPDGSIRFSSIVLSRPYTRLMLRDRYKKYLKAKENGLTDAEFRKQIFDEYVSRGWITKDGRPDIWAELRWWRRQAIKLGMYEPRKYPRRYDSSKPHRKLSAGGGIDRAHVRRQAKKYRDNKKEAKAKGVIKVAYQKDRPSGDIIYDETKKKYVSRKYVYDANGNYKIVEN